MKQKIAFIGLGKMGSAMATRILQAGLELTVYNRTRKKADALKGLGATVSDTLETAVSDADIVFTSLIDDEALTTVTEKMLPELKKGTIHVSTSTVLPETTKQLAQLHEDAACHYITSPVLGVPKAVLAGKSTTLCSGHQKSIDTITPILNTYSIAVENLGGQITDAIVLKICMNYTLISALELISELYAFAEKSGLKSEIVQASLHHIYAHPAVKLYIDKIHARNFDDVNFSMSGGNKDVNLFQQAFSEVGVVPDIANIIRGKFTEALGNDDLAGKDWSAISEIVRGRSGLN